MHVSLHQGDIAVAFSTPACTGEPLGHILPSKPNPSPAESISVQCLPVPLSAPSLPKMLGRGQEQPLFIDSLSPSLPWFCGSSVLSTAPLTGLSSAFPSLLYISWCGLVNPTASSRGISSPVDRGLSLDLGFPNSSLYQFFTWPALNPRAAWGCVSPAPEPQGPSWVLKLPQSECFYRCPITLCPGQG